MIRRTIAYFQSLLATEEPLTDAWQPQWSFYLNDTVIFYRILGDSDKKVFERRCLEFLSTTNIESRDDNLTDEDRLLVAASAIIPVWAFPDWRYFNLDAVHILPAAFNEQFLCYQSDSTISGMVGRGSLAGKMVLSREDLHLGFANSRDCYNVGIHEFAHLVDIADGKSDGVPEFLMHSRECSIQWLNFVAHKIDAIESGRSTLRKYAATNEAEFFAVATEFFFEQPGTMKERYPGLYDALSRFYKQDVLDIERAANPLVRNN